MLFIYSDRSNAIYIRHRITQKVQFCFLLVERETTSTANISTMPLGPVLLPNMGGSLELMTVLPLTFHYIQHQNKHDLHVSISENFFHILFHFT